MPWKQNHINSEKFGPENSVTRVYRGGQTRGRLSKFHTSGKGRFSVRIFAFSETLVLETI